MRVLKSNTDKIETMRARNTVSIGETALIIFTDGRGLAINEDGTGLSGVWRISKTVSFDRVVIYYRNNSKNHNEIHLGDFSQLLPSNEPMYPDRFVVEFEDMQFVGLTESNWNEFTDTKRGFALPFKYLR